MRYELLLQAEPGQPFDAEAVDAALAERGVSAAATTERLWRLPSGDVEVRGLVEQGTPRATELRVPLSHRDELVRELLPAALEVAQAARVRLFDPQLCRALTAADQGALLAQYERLARYAGQYGGESSAVLIGFQEPEGGLRPGTKVALALGALLLLALWLLHRLTS